MKYTIASRGSKLALVQANFVQQQLRSLFPGHEWEIKTYTTTGDRFQDRPLSSFGGKGAFLKEIEEALLSGEAHLAVHSLKDVPSIETSGLQLQAFLPREDPRDVWISRQEAMLHLPPGKLVGTSSLRRNVLLGVYRSDLRIEQLRGNLDTRLRKVNEGQVDAIVVAAAGLHRLQLFDDAYMHYLSEDAFIPAVGQGILVVQTGKGQGELTEMLTGLDDPSAHTAALIERKFLSFYEGGCQLPIGALATKTETGWTFRGFIGGIKSRQIVQDLVQSVDPELCAPQLHKKLHVLGSTALLAELEQA